MQRKRNYRTCPHCGITGPAGGINTHIRWKHASSAVDRFWARVDKSAANGCWVWTGYRQKFGHGAMGLAQPGKRTTKTILAHRYSWELVNGPVPEGKCVLHRCDNPPCVNPDHLYLGDRTDNANDKVKRGRVQWGEGTKRNKLTTSQVLEIRAAFQKFGLSRQSGSNAAELGQKYGVKALTINNIVSRRTWRHLR